MNIRPSLAVSLCLWAAAALCCDAQPVPESLRRAWAERTVVMNAERVTWHYALHRRPRLTPQQRADIEQQNRRIALERAREELARQGGTQETVEQAAREFAETFAASVSLREVAFRGELTLTLDGDKASVRVQEPVGSAQGVESILWEVVYDANVVIVAPQSWSFAGRRYAVTDLEQPRREGVGIPWVRVWKSHSPAYLRRLSRFPLFVTPELLILLSGVSPEQLYSGQWTLERENAEEWVLRQRVVEGDLAPFTVRIGFLKSRGGAPSWAEITQERGTYREVYRVTSWQQPVRGNWRAKTVVDIRTSDFYEDRRTWHWKQAEPLPEGKRLTLDIPKGMPVADYRLLGASVTLEEMSNRRDAMVGYEWDGALPSERELRQMVARRAQSHGVGSQRVAVLWRFLPPLLLITIGVLWYWRLKRVEGKG